MQTSSLPILVLLASLSGCAGGGVGALAGAALQATGLRAPAELPEAQRPPRIVPLRLHAGEQLNLDRDGRPLAVVARLYLLRQRAGFEQLPYASFLGPDGGRAALGADLVEVKEFTLVPGQRLELSEKVAREAAYLGVLALFHTPAAGRWRVAVASADAESEGLTVGLHACALSLGRGAQPAGAALPALSSVRCQ